ncbi:MAG: EI24 domain-containing protein [Verrucomicrobiota bacterium]|nr:EI24 domain-containing protein [Verrucomicrobiota bacterium]
MKKIIQKKTDQIKTSTKEVLGPLELYFSSINMLKKHPTLLKYVFLAFFSTLITFIVLFFLGLWGFNAFSDAYITNQNWGRWGTALEWIIRSSYFIGYCILFFFSFSAVGNIVSLPFLDMLSEKVETIIRKKTEVVPFWEAIIPGMKSALVMLLIKITVTILCLPLLFIPVIGTIAFFTIEAWFVGFDYLDFPMGRRGWKYKRKNEFFKKNSLKRLSFGAITLTGLMIPFVSFFIFPIATIAGTLFFIEMDENNS